jgi:hypothetical protein
LRKITDGLGARPLSLLVGSAVAVQSRYTSSCGLRPLGVGRLACEQPLQFPFETAVMRGNGSVGDIGPAAAIAGGERRAGIERVEASITAS